MKKILREDGFTEVLVIPQGWSINFGNAIAYRTKAEYNRAKRDEQLNKFPKTRYKLECLEKAAKYNDEFLKIGGASEEYQRIDNHLLRLYNGDIHLDESKPTCCENYNECIEECIGGCIIGIAIIGQWGDFFIRPIFNKYFKQTND